MFCKGQALRVFVKSFFVKNLQKNFLQKTLTERHAPFQSAFFFSFFLFFLFFLGFLFKIFRRSINFKSRIMLNFKVRTYNPEKGTPENSIFILSRGKNAGKPLFEPCPNCFILYCRNETEKESLYWIFYSLWENGFFHPYLCGSVIDMLRLSDLKLLLRQWIQPSFEKANRNPELICKIKSIEELEKKMQQQQELIIQLRGSIVKKLYLEL